MRAGYVALFSLIVAYSAYQGNTPRTNHLQREHPVDHGSDTSLNSNLIASSPETESFPTIARGIFKVEITQETKEPCPSHDAICPARELEDLISDYFQPEIPLSENPERKKSLGAWGVPSDPKNDIEFIIATVPDPVHTHMALWFDRWVDAIEKAAQAGGYLFSRAWMPWDISTHSEATDFTVRMAQAKLQAKKELLPGLMIFRKPERNGSFSSLFVFVVGETPTGGLHAKQFQNAVYIRQSILKHSLGVEGPTHLLIFGPASSGSLQSLAVILNNMPHDWFSRIVIRSGSVSSYLAEHDFCEAIRHQWTGSTTSRPEFTTFQFSDQYEEFFLSYFFLDRHEAHSHVAVLSEDETEFGNQETMPGTPQADGQEDGTGCSPEPAAPLIPLTRLYFPRDIAELRDAYQQNIKAQAEGSSGANSAPPPNRLPLTLGVTGSDDSVAPYAPLQTPLSQESIMQAIVSTLRQRHAKVVIIRATNPLDMVFLARYLRQNYPQARLVTSLADLLMVYDVTDPRFHGILAVTSYPLLNGASFPTRKIGAESGAEVQRTFPDGFSLGAFNAFLSLLGPQLTQPLLPGQPYAQFGLPSFLENQTPWRPHLWLTAVGRDGYWPVAALDDISQHDIDEKEKDIQTDTARKPDPTMPAVDATIIPPMQYTVHFSVGWAIFWALTFSLSLGVSFLLVYARASSGSEIVARFARSPSRARNGLLFAGCMLLLLSQTLFAFPAIAWLTSFGAVDKDVTGWPRVSEYIDGVWLVWICYLISVAVLAYACRKRFTKELRCEEFSRVGFYTCLAFGITTVISTWAVPWQGFSSGFHNFIYRYIHVESGVSPLLPLFFALSAWLWWWWQSLTGVASSEEKHMVLPSLSDFDEKSAPSSFELAVKEAYDRVRLKALAVKKNEWPWNTLKPVPFHKKLTISAMLGLLGILLLMRPSEIAEAFEPQAYKWVYWILLYSCLFLICYLVIHIVVLWLQLRNLLRAIERVPFRRGFGDLKNLTWKPLWRLAGSGRQEFTRVFGQEVDALRQIKNSKPPGGPLTDAIEAALNATEAVSAEYERNSKSNPEVPRLFEDVQQKMAKATSQALIFASENWKDEKYSPPPKPDTTKDSEEKPKVVEQPAKDPILRAVEYFLCLFYLNVILVPLRRLQTLILAMAGVFVFVMVSYSSYPFESRESFHALLISILFAISLAVGIVYGQMYANPLLSRITNTKPGELGLDFWVRLGTFIFVPLLSVLSVQFPEINSFLFSWLQPALQSVK